MTRIVRRGREGIRNLEQSMARPRGLLLQATTAIAQALRAAGVRTSRRSALAETRRITATAAIRSRRSGPITTRLPTIITAAIRSRALTIRRPRPRTRRRELIPHRAAAIQRLHVPTLRPAAAEGAVEVVAAIVAAGARTVAGVVEVAEAVVAEAHTAVEVAEVHTAVEAPALTATINLLAR